MTLTTKTSRRRRGLNDLIARAAGAEDLSVCVQSALSTLAALAGGPGGLDCIDEGRAKAAAAGDDELADLLRRAVAVLEKRATRPSAVAA